MLHDIKYTGICGRAGCLILMSAINGLAGVVAAPDTLKLRGTVENLQQWQWPYFLESVTCCLAVVLAMSSHNHEQECTHSLNWLLVLIPLLV